jgi:type IV secretion system protein VirD4
MNIKVIGIIFAIIVYAVVGFFAAEYLAGALYFVISKVMPENITLDTWATYWHWYSSDPTQKKRLQMAAGLAGIIVYVIPVLIASSMRGAGRSLHGDARFAKVDEIRKAGLFADNGIIVGKQGSQYLMFDGQQFVMLAAPTRSGKGVAVVIPNLLNYGGSVVVLDIKLENFKMTSGFREAHGQKVFLFNPFAEDGMTHRWNPLGGISKNKNFRVGDVLAIGQALYPNDNAKEAFWNDQARNLFLGLALYLLETPDLPCTLGELLRQSSGKGLPIKDYLTNIMASRSEGENALSDECLDALNRFCSTSENTMASILATFNAPLTIFANPIVDAATSESDFDVRHVRSQLMSIYIGIQPNRLADASLLINLFFSQLINLNTNELPADNPHLKYQCLLILDEFTAIGKVGIIAKAVSYIAGYNIRLMPIIQSISQLESVYGKEDTRTFVTNHALQILYPPREQKDANEYSEMLGYFTEKAVSKGVSRPRAWGSNNASDSENTSDHKRALLLPQELKELGQDKEILIVENTKPILCDKARYFSDHSFIDRLKGISPSLAALGKQLPSKSQLEHATFVSNELASKVPILDLDLHRAKMERRTRPLGDDEPIDLSKLAMDLGSLPELDNPENPSEESVAALCDAFFSQLDWTSSDDELPEDSTSAPSASEAQSEDEQPENEINSIEPSYPENAIAFDEIGDEPSDDYFNDLQGNSSDEKPQKIDLSVLDS